VNAETDPAVTCFCPECGYNLTGIPEDRCPECGFGFQLAAIRDIAQSQANQRLRVYRSVVTLGLIGVVSAAVGGIAGYWPVPNSLWVYRALLGGSLLLLLTVPFRSGRPSWGVFLAIVLGMQFSVFGLAAPRAFAVLAVFMPPIAVVRLLALPKQYPRADLSLTAEEAAEVRKWRGRAWVVLAAAFVAMVVELVGW
jgi:hypothetical protein